jgi:hypothetical protein
MELSELLPQIGSEDPEKVLAAAQRVTQMLRAVGCSWSDLRVSRRRPRDPALRLARHAARERCRADELAALERAREIVRDWPDSTSTVRPLRAEVAALTVLLGLADQRSPASCARPRPQEIPTLWRKGNGVTFPLPAHRRCPCCETGRGTSETRSRRDDAARRLRGRVDRWLWAGKGSYHEGMPKLPGRD